MKSHSNDLSAFAAVKKAPKNTNITFAMESQQKPRTDVIVIYDGPNTNVKPVEKLVEPECCCGCNIATASIIMAVLNILWAFNLRSLPDQTFTYIFGAIGLCYAGIAFVRSANLCYIASAVNHLISIPCYLYAIILIITAIALFQQEDGNVKLAVNDELAVSNEFTGVTVNKNEVATGSLVVGICFLLYGMVLTYMGKKFQEFGEYLEKEEKAIDA